MAAAAQAGVTIPIIAAVAIFTDAPSAAVLSGLPGLELDPAAVRSVLNDPDPVSAGIAAAAREARALLDIPRVVGVNISGVASARGYEFAAQVKAELARRIREQAPLWRVTPVTRWRPSSAPWPSGRRRWRRTWARSTSFRRPAAAAGGPRPWTGCWPDCSRAPAT